MTTNYCWTYFRNRIVLDQQFVSERIPKGQLPDGGTLLTAARDFEVAQEVDLKGYNLVILADHFDGSKGWIEVSSGQPGAGATGPSARNVTIACRALAGAQVRSLGGAGQDGRAGIDKPDQDEPGVNGLNGGFGHDGGDGSNGGDVTIIWADSMPGGIVPKIHIQLKGGRAGIGGRGGKGGAGGPAGPNGNPPPGKDGKDGKDGKNGTPGTNGHFVETHLSETDYWKHVSTLSMPEWAAYRQRVAEYYYRGFCPSDQTSDCYRMARDEFDAVLELDPENSIAKSYKSQLVNYQNFFGLEWDLDVIPDFDFYNQLFTDHGPMITSLFLSANSLLKPGLGLTAAKFDLMLRYNSLLNGLIPAQAKEVEAARNGQTAAQTEADHAAKLVEDNLKQIQECQNATISFGEFITTAAAIAGAIAAIWTGDAGLIAAIPAILKVGEGIVEGGIDPFNPSDAEKRQLEEAAGGLTDFVKMAEGIINFIKVIRELSQAASDSPKCLALVREGAKLAYDRLLADLRKNQSDALREAETIRYRQYQADLAALDKQIKNLTGEITSLKQASFTLIANAQGCADILMKYGFQAARALQIYTMDDTIRLPRFDYSFIPPDDEQDFLDEFNQDIVSMIQRRQQSWTELEEVMLGYEAHLKSYLASGIQESSAIVDIQDAALINRCREEYAVPFGIRLEGLPSDHCEARVSSLEVSLVGAKVHPAAGQFSCNLEHSGPCVAKRRDGVIVTMYLRPRSVALDLLQDNQPDRYSGDIAESKKPHFACWGRSPAADWRLFIDREVIITNPETKAEKKYKVDLSGLTEVRVRIGYEYFPG